MRVKAGVQPPLVHLLAGVSNAEREHVKARLRELGVADDLLADAFSFHHTVTSGLDGAHSTWSGHYQLRAVDVRVSDIPADRHDEACQAVREEIEALMPAERVWVDIHGPVMHLHAQFK